MSNSKSRAEYLKKVLCSEDLNDAMPVSSVPPASEPKEATIDGFAKDREVKSLVDQVKMLLNDVHKKYMISNADPGQAVHDFNYTLTKLELVKIKNQLKKFLASR